MLIEILIALEFFDHFFCSALVQLVGTIHKASQQQNDALFGGHSTNRVETKGKFKFPVNQMNYFAMPMKCY